MNSFNDKKWNLVWLILHWVRVELSRVASYSFSSWVLSFSSRPRRHCFESGDFLQRENLRSTIRQRQCLCTVSFLGASLLKNLDFRCCLGGVCAASIRTGTLTGLLFFSFFFSFWLCASVLPLGYCVVAEAGCNWYLHDINIFLLSKKLNQKRNIHERIALAKRILNVRNTWFCNNIGWEG
jgi:hypothetical protein